MVDILCMDKCLCVVHLFYMRGLILLMFIAFAHACYMCVLFKFWVYCTVTLNAEYS